MCGITGYLTLRGDAPAPGVLQAMSDALTHRGPDAAGHWADAPRGIALGHRRLAILDCSPTGAQPMRSESGRWHVVYNGEVYNYRTLARELASRGHRFRGTSDTEVILAAVEEWGVEAAARRFAGIFALALWDAAEQTLYLVRDHLGVKPLHYAWVGGTFVFGSELKALTRFPGFAADIDRGALALLLRSNCIPAPHTIYTGVRKLPPGTTLAVRAGAESAEPRPYWSARETVIRARSSPLALSDADAVDALDEALRGVIAEQMVADVPVGAFLSGGIDSSTVVALMQAESPGAVRTFTIGFDVPSYDEAPFARAVARHLGTEHTELYLSPDDALAVVPELPTLYDEPFADSSQIPTLLVARLARRHVTVSLSGDGGDELFGGYNRHVLGPRIWRRIRRVPRPLRKMAASAIAAVPPDLWERGVRATGLARGRSVSANRFGANLHKLAEVLDAPSPRHIYRRLTSHWKRPQAIVLGATEPRTVLSDPAEWMDDVSFAEAMMYLDLVSYLPDDILVKVDRASMSVGLEARVPLLDPRIVELAWRLPQHQKIRDGVGKWALREVLYRRVPRALLERPKAGFGLPLDSWLRGPLRDWAESLLSAERLRADGFFDPAPIRAMWAAHLSGRTDAQYLLWDVLMFQAWYHHRARR